MKLKFRLLLTLCLTIMSSSIAVAACGPEAGQLPCCDSALSQQYGSKITDPKGPPVVTLTRIGGRTITGPDGLPTVVGGRSQFYNNNDANPVAAVNCTNDTDPSCASGYCGYANDDSPINLSNTFGQIVDDIGTFGAPSRLLNDFKALEIVDPTSSTPSQLTYNSSGALTEGAVLAINNCTGDWAKCKPILYDTNGNACANFTQVLAPSSAAPNMAKPAIAADGSFLSDANGRQLYCPLLRANVPTGDIFYHIVSTNTFSNINANSTPQVTSFGSFFDAPTILTGVVSGDLFCIQASFQTWWFSTNTLNISCKYNIPPNPHPPLPKPTQSDSSTVSLDPSCSDPTKAKTLASYSVFGKFMQCINATFTNMFTKPSISATPNPILQFQINLRNVVAIALTLYIIAFGIKITAGGMPKKAELFMFIIKFALVFYFAVGTFSDPTNASAVSESQNGLVYYFNQLFKVMAEFSNNIILAGNKADNGFCYFDPNWYDSDYSFLALWDSLDCHMTSYLGFTSLIDGSVNATNILSLIWTYFLGFNPLMTIFLTVFAFFTISVIVNLVKIFVISMFGLTFLALLGPLFIPMALFSYTKSYFESWLALVFSFVLQPAIVSAGVALILVTLDSQIYDQCVFKTITATPIESSTDTLCSSSSAQGSCYAVFDTSDSNYSNCQNSFGYWAAAPALSVISKNHSVAGMFTYTAPFPTSSSITAPLMTTVIMLFLFYQFVNVLASFAGDLTSGMGLGRFGPSPQDTRILMEKILTAASSIKGKKAIVSAIANKFGKKPRKADDKTEATTTDGDTAEIAENKARAKNIGELAAEAGRARLERLAKATPDPAAGAGAAAGAIPAALEAGATGAAAGGAAGAGAAAGGAAGAGAAALATLPRTAAGAESAPTTTETQAVPNTTASTLTQTPTQAATAAAAPGAATTSAPARPSAQATADELHQARLKSINRTSKTPPAARVERKGGAEGVPDQKGAEAEAQLKAENRKSQK